MFNKKVWHKVREKIKREPEHFNLLTVESECGTTKCIAGHLATELGLPISPACYYASNGYTDFSLLRKHLDISDEARDDFHQLTNSACLSSPSYAGIDLSPCMRNDPGSNLLAVAAMDAFEAKWGTNNQP